MSKVTSPMDAIATHAERYAAARHALQDLLSGIQEAQRRLVAEHLPEIRKRIAAVAERESELRAWIEACPELFEKPRTRVFNGVKVGFRKGKGKIEIDDEQRTIELIKKRLPDEADRLINVIERVNRRQIEGLPAADVKRIGVRLVESGDEIVIRPVDGELEKMVAALLKDIQEDLA